MSKVLGNSRWDWAWFIECKTCGWSNLSQDYSYTKYAGVVHAEMLKLGHELVSTEPMEVTK